MPWAQIAMLAALAGLAAILFWHRRAWPRIQSDADDDPRTVWQEKQIESVLFVSEGNAPAGFRVVAEKKRVWAVAESRNEAERQLRLRAARMGANAVTGFRLAARPDEDRSRQRRTMTSADGPRASEEWEGTAVAVVEAQRKGWFARLLGRVDQERLAVLDGSNVLHAAGHGPDLASVRGVAERLRSDGWTPYLIFDANIGYKALGRPVNEQELASLLGVPANRVMIVPGGRQADPYVIQFARENRAVVVTNDLYRDNWEKMRGLPRFAVKFEEGRLSVR